jgi:hypothetical protein
VSQMIPSCAEYAFAYARASRSPRAQKSSSMWVIRAWSWGWTIRTRPVAATDSKIAISSP